MTDPIEEAARIVAKNRAGHESAAAYDELSVNNVYAHMDKSTVTGRDRRDARDIIAAYHAAQPSDYMGVKKFLRGAKVSPIEEVKCRQAAAAIEALEAEAESQSRWISRGLDRAEAAEARVAELEKLVYVAVDPMTLPDDMLAVFNKGNRALFPDVEKDDE